MSKKHDKNQRAWQKITSHVMRGEEAVALLESIHIYDLLAAPTTRKEDSHKNAQLDDIRARLNAFFEFDDGE
jgi:hypothetical protein